jgi:hypothetical protein
MQYLFTVLFHLIIYVVQFPVDFRELSLVLFIQFFLLIEAILFFIHYFSIVRKLFVCALDLIIKLTLLTL